jgi:hypothetical protein
MALACGWLLQKCARSDDTQPVHHVCSRVVIRIIGAGRVVNDGGSLDATELLTAAVAHKPTELVVSADATVRTYVDECEIV